MPELPEVETISRQLNQVLVGKKISKIEVLRERSFFGDPSKIIGWEIEKVGRKSKVIEIRFNKKDELVIVHLKMTGQLIYILGDKRVAGGHPTVDWVKDLPSKHTRVIWDFSDGSKLFFNDMRVFGWIKLMSLTKYESEVRGKAPDVTDEDFTLSYFNGLFNQSKKAVKLVLLDQEKIGGIGNIYANDALFLAGIMPDRLANSLNEVEKVKLYEAVKEVINLGIKYGGASASNYVNVSGMGGTYQDHFLVYKRDGQECKNCKRKIEKTRIGGRGTFYCSNCQK
jgi:formamidopyrimidine-DNA glycosylase